MTQPLDGDERSPRVAIIYSSPAEHDLMAQAGALLARFGVTYDECCMSPHRSPRALVVWMAGAIDGRDALLGLTQLPQGVPVAAVGIDNTMNAAVLAVQVLAVGDQVLRKRLWRFKDDFEKAAAR